MSALTTISYFFGGLFTANTDLGDRLSDRCWHRGKARQFGCKLAKRKMNNRHIDPQLEKCALQLSAFKQTSPESGMTAVSARSPQSRQRLWLRFLKCEKYGVT